MDPDLDHEIKEEDDDDDDEQEGAYENNEMEEEEEDEEENDDDEMEQREDSIVKAFRYLFFTVDDFQKSDAYDAIDSYRRRLLKEDKYVDKDEAIEEAVYIRKRNILKFLEEPQDEEEDDTTDEDDDTARG